MQTIRETHSHTTYDKDVADAVLKGLSTEPKTLPSWLFYDETGDRLFQEIMRMPEYYPTRCEYDILQQHKDALLKHFTERARTFKLIELGAGDGLKTEILLQHFMSQGIDFTYLPVDISAHSLDVLSKRLNTTLPGLRIKPINKTYYEALKDLRGIDDKKIILFMGANIGNFTIPEASAFLSKLVIPLTGKDMLLIGFDLKKDPRIIQEAYDDPRGLTREFNLNILVRINRELGANFTPSEFTHSWIRFTGHGVGKNHPGTFDLSYGQVTANENTITGGTFVIDVTSMDMEQEDEMIDKKLRPHLMSGDFFDANTFGTSRFEITKVEPYKAKEGEKSLVEGANFSISGNLQIKDVTKNITFPARVDLDGNTLKAKANFDIDRREWQMNYGNDKTLGDNFISETVNIEFNIQARRKSDPNL